VAGPLRQRAIAADLAAGTRSPDGRAATDGCTVGNVAPRALRTAAAVAVLGASLGVFGVALTVGATPAGAVCLDPSGHPIPCTTVPVTAPPLPPVTQPRVTAPPVTSAPATPRSVYVPPVTQAPRRQVTPLAPVIQTPVPTTAPPDNATPPTTPAPVPTTEAPTTTSEPPTTTTDAVAVPAATPIQLAAGDHHSSGGIPVVPLIVAADVLVALCVGVGYVVVLRGRGASRAMHT